jgi:hypothetical protein
VGHGLGVPEIVDGNDLEVRTTLEMSAKEVPPDASESVDPYASRRHATSLINASAADAGSAGVGWNPLASRSEIVQIIMAREARRISGDKRRAGGEAPRTTSSSG